MTAPDGDTSVFDACLQSVEGCKNITAIRGNIQLSAADLMFNRQGREFIIKEWLEAHKSGFDVVIMDTPPALGVLTVNALTSANTVVVPISPDGYSLQGFYQLNENIRLIKKYSNPQLKIGGILVTRYVPNTIVSREIKEIAQEYAGMAGTKVYKSVIRQTVLVSESICRWCVCCALTAATPVSLSTGYRADTNLLLLSWGFITWPDRDRLLTGKRWAE